MKQFALLLLIAVSAFVTANAQINVGSSQAPDSSAMLQISGNTKGFLPPRMSRTEMNAIAKPAKGLIVFSTTDSVLYMRRDTGWVALTSGSDLDWSKTGNAGINATNFLGTTDNRSLRFRTNNAKRVILDSIGNMAVGTDTFDATNPERFLINAGNTTSVNGLVVKGSNNNYFQMNIKNLSSGSNATSDIVATADNGTETTNYVDLGINGSGYAGGAIQTGVANDGYLISSGNDFYVVNSSANKNMLFLTGGTGVANERMRILANGRVGMGVQDPSAPFVVKDTMEIRRIGSLSQLLFTNTAGSGDFRIGGDGGDIFWQGGGGRALQMGSYWTTVLSGDRLNSSYPSFVSGLSGTGVLVAGQRDASVPLGIQANSGSQSANLTEWRNASGTVLSAVTKDGNIGIGVSNPSTKLHIVGTNPLTLNGVQTGASTDSILTIINGTVKKLSPSALVVSSSNAWGLTGNTNTLSNNYFLGTTNSDPLIFKVNSQIAGRLDGSNTYFGTAAGNSNGTTANQNTGIGYQALSGNTSGTYNTAIGYGSLQGNVSGSNNIGVGYNAAVANNSSNSIAIGVSSYVNNASSIAIGTSAQTNNTSGLAIGNYTYVNGTNAIAIGNGTSSARTQGFGNYSIALGNYAYAGGANSIAIGNTINSNASNSIAIGASSQATVANSTALGASASAGGINSTAIGYNAAVASDNTVIIGDKANTSLSVGIGSEVFSSGNREKLLVDAGNTSSFNVISGKGNINNYLQLNIQNKNAGTGASSDLVATADNGDENNNYVDLGINSSANNANVFGAANDAYLYTQGQNLLVGTATAAKSVAFLTGGSNQSTNERMRIDGSGNVGIGITSPSTKLHIVGTNPLTLTGVQTGTNTSADSLLTITNGLVKKLPLSTLSISSDWSSTGNANTTSGSNFLGTTNNASLKFRTNNTQRLLIDSLGNVAIGINPTFAASPNAERLLVDAGSTSGNPTTSYNLINGKGYIDNYLQFNIQNKSAGASASSDVVATADNGDESSGFIDMGINSSGNASTGAIGGVGTAYLYSTGNDLAIGNGSANKSIVFFTGGLTQSTYTERFRLDASGRVGIGTKTPASDLAIFQSAGTGGSKGVTFAGNSIGGTNSGSGFLMSLGYNQSGNKQLWFGDPDYANNSAGTFLRFAIGGTFLPTLDAVAGDNSTRRFLALGTGGDANAGVIFGNDGNAASPSSFVWGNGNMAIGSSYRTNAAPANGLLVQGNTGVGATAFNSSNPEKLLVDNGASGNTNFQNVIVGKGNTNSYAQLNIQNANTGTAASSDVVATADNGSETNNYIDMGINGSGNTANNFGSSNDAYLFNVGQNLLIGTATAAKSVVFLTGGSTQSSNERMRIDGSGNVGIGTTTPTAALQLKAGTSAANTAPLKLTSGTNLSTPEAGAVEFDGTNYFVTASSTRYTMAKTLTSTATLDFPSTNAGSSSTLTITVNGAVDGDVVSLGVPVAASSGINGMFSAYVSAANTVTIKFLTGTTENPAAGTFRISVLKY